MIVFAVLTGCICLTASARADVRKGEILFGPYGLYTIPTDDYPSPRLDDVPYFEMGNKVDPSPGLAGAVDRMMSSRLSLGGEFKVYFSTVDEEVLQDFIDNHITDLDEVEMTWRTVHFGARARYYMNPEKRVNPFLQGGVGIYVSKLRAELSQIRGSGSSNDFSRSESFTDPGVSIGPGALIRISKDARLSVDAIFTNIFTADRNVRYLGLSLGLLFGVTPD
jgi:hypothetical protein